MAFSPHYASNHLFYVSYTNVDGNSRVVRYRSANGVGVRSSAKILLRVRQPYSNHNGGQLSSTSAATSTSGSATAAPAAIRNRTPRTCTRGSASCFAPRRKSPNTRWKTVAARPAQSVALLVRPGDEQPLDRRRRPGHVGGGRLPAGCQARQARELRLEPLRGLLASTRRATRTRRPAARCARSSSTRTTHGCSVTGGYVYRGSAVHAARGRYFYGDYCAGTIWSFRGRQARPRLAAAVSGHVPSLSSFGVDGHGELYATSLGGTLYKLR